MEAIVQHKSGIHFIKVTLFRIVMAALTILVISQFFGDTSQSVVVPAELSVYTPLPELLKDWVVDTVLLLLKILGIVMFIMVALESLKSMGWMEYLLRFFRPLMGFMGLSKQTTMMFVAAVIFGLIYGGAVIVEESRKGTLTREELECLHISVGINHSMIEDPAVFSVLGINILWLVIPKFLAAIIAVQAYRGALYIKRKAGW